MIPEKRSYAVEFPSGFLPTNGRFLWEGYQSTPKPRRGSGQANRRIKSRKAKQARKRQRF